MVSLKELIKMDLKYPGIDVSVELTVLRAYLSQMEIGIQSVCNNYIAQEMASYGDSEPWEYQHVYQIAEEEMPRIIRMPIVVMLCSVFENSVSRLLDYAKEKENKTLAPKDIKAKSKIHTYNKYMKHVLEYDFSFDEKTIQNIKRIYLVRQYVAHSNGSLANVSKEKMAQLTKISNQVDGIEFGESGTSMNIDISYRFLEESFTVIASSLKDLMQYMEVRYQLQ